jgi:hypothetical protein
LAPAVVETDFRRPDIPGHSQTFSPLSKGTTHACSSFIIHLPSPARCAFVMTKAQRAGSFAQDPERNRKKEN